MFELQDVSFDYTQLTPLRVLEQAGILSLPRQLHVKTPARPKPPPKENPILILNYANTDISNDGRKVSLLKNQQLHQEIRNIGSSSSMIAEANQIVPGEDSGLSELDSVVQQALFSRDCGVTVDTPELCDAAKSLPNMLAPDNDNTEFDGMDTRSVLTRRMTTSVTMKKNKKGVVCSVCSHVFANTSVLERHQVLHTGVRPYNCNVCFKEFSDVSSHRKHSFIHKRQHRCPVCHRMYLRRTQLLLHVKQHRKRRFIQFGNGFFEVQVNVTRSSVGQLVQEYTLPILQAQEKTEKCVNSSMPDGHTVAKEGLDEISIRSDPNVTESEPTGNIIPSDASTLEGQPETEQKQKTVYRCGHCQMVIFTRPTLFRHLIKHTNTRPFQCEECLKSFHDKADLLHHYKTHTKPVQCRTCMSSFSKYLYLQNHLLKGCPIMANDSRFTVLSDLRCQCNICQKILKSKANILRHLRVHAFQERKKSSGQATSDTNVTVEVLYSTESEGLSQNVEDHFQCLLNSVGYRCLICGQEFRFKSFIITHVRMHLNQRPYKCQDCPKSFYARHLLKKHQQNHTKPYKCPACNKSFIRRYIMRNHFKKRHEQEDPLKDVTELVEEGLIQCDICGKTMKSYQKSVMLCHIRLHKDVRPFKCRVCDKSFISDNAVRKHSLNHTKPYKCHICSKGFSRRYLLTDHFKKKCSRKKGTNTVKKDDLVSDNSDQKVGNSSAVILATSTEGSQQYNAKVIKEQDINTGTVTYTCEPCDKRFTVYEALMRHINTFSKATPCKYCGQVFEDKHMTMLHQRSCLGLAVIASQKCTKKIITVGTQQEKVQKIMKDISKKIENLSSKASSSKIDEENDVEELVDSAVLKNDSNQFSIKNKSGNSQEQSIPLVDTLDDTQMQSMALKDLPIDTWAASMRKYYKLSTNKEHGPGVRESQFSCPECDRSFATTRGLKIHASSHVRLFKCEVCDKDFTQICDLRAHAKFHVTGVEVNIEPEVTFSTKSPNKQQQEDTKHGTAAHISQEPPASTKSGISWKRSRKISTSKRGKDSEDYLISEKMHKRPDLEEVNRRLMQSGTRGRPYSCKMCRRRFTEQSGLDVHLLQNHGVGP